MNSNDKPRKDAPQPSPKQQRGDPHEVRWLTPEEIEDLRESAKRVSARIKELIEADKAKAGK